MTEALLRLDNIHVSFIGSNGSRRLRVLEGIDLVVPQGQFLAILGPSGCGKSTLLRVMAGLIEPERGSVTWRSGDLEERATRMALNFQKPVLLPWLSVRDNALLPCRLGAKRFAIGETEMDARLDELLALAGLDQFRNALPHELSGGMQMRAALVRTLVTRPSLVFMDEPFAAIDELTRQDLGRELRQLMQESNASTIFVTHSIQEAAFLADRICILSPRPSHLVEDITASYDQPMRDEQLRRDKSFLDLCDHLREVMAHG
ncbi:MAG: ABC transporter ATP-binding protein [Panacagrimonas sp.]